MTQNAHPADNFYAEVRAVLKEGEVLDCPTSSHRREAATPEIGHLVIPIQVIPLQGGPDRKRMDELRKDLKFVPKAGSEYLEEKNDRYRSVTITRAYEAARDDYLAGAEMTLSMTFNIADNPFSRG